MKLSCRARSDRALVLLDLLVYMSVLAIVLILAAVVFNRGLTESGNLRRNVAEIEQAMKAGERWREDIRAATGPIETHQETNGSVVTLIPHGDGKVAYEITQRHAVRWGNSETPDILIRGVKSARMIEERRGEVAGWRWEVELETRRKNAKVRPLFTFMAVPGNER